MEEARGHSPTRRRTIPTGFEVLDRVLGGGIRTRDLTLVGGQPGIGKTISTLQWARRAAVEEADVSTPVTSTTRTPFSPGCCTWSWASERR
ncbi:MAG: ATPase domain-containing protein [Acidimicrobiia bacterium]